MRAVSVGSGVGGLPITAALHHDRDRPATLASGEMRICPKCRTTYTSSLSEECYRDGHRLMDYRQFLDRENDPLRGVTIGGKYTLDYSIGQGGMGKVYKAVQQGLQRNVAIKILKRELNLDPDTVARFHREANAMSLLTHPNTVRVYDFGQTDDGLLYLVMELLEGELITHQLNQGPIAVERALRYAQQILRSLSEAHSKGLIHRDLKPDNIFVAQAKGQDEPVIKVLDFGIAKVVAPDRRVDQFETQAGTVFGTPRYMSPEQAQGAALDQRSDLYTVGTLLYQMLTGRAPFTGDDAVVVMAKHIQEPPEPPSRVVRGQHIPMQVEAAVMRALAKDPGERFQSAAEFEAVLESCRDQTTGSARSLETPVVSDAPTGGRHWALLIIVLVLSSLLIALWVVRSRSASQARPQSVRLASPESLQVKPVPSAAPVGPIVSAVAPAVAPGPTVVMVRSNPDGALVERNGESLGKTPLELLLDPEEEVVRVQLTLDGYIPLAAELSAQQGERTLELLRQPRAEAAEKRPARPLAKRKKKPRRTSGQRPSERPKASHHPKAPASTPSVAPPPAPRPGPEGSPYERFQ